MKTVFYPLVFITSILLYSTNALSADNSCPGDTQDIVDAIIESTGEKTACTECKASTDQQGRTSWWGKCEWDKGSRIELTFSSNDRDPFDTNQPNAKTKNDIKNGALFEFEARRGWPSKTLLREGSFTCKVNDKFNTSYLGMFAYDAWNSGKVPEGYLEDLYDRIYVNLYEKGICVPIPGHTIDTSVAKSTKSGTEATNKAKTSNKLLTFNQPQEDFPYQSKTKISFQYPESYHISNEGNRQYKLIPYDNKDTWIYWQLRSRKDDYYDNKKLTAKQLMNGFMVKRSGVNVLASEEVTYSGLPGYIYVISVDNNKRHITRVILDAGDYFLLTFLTTRINQYDKYQPDFDTILSNISVSGVTPPKTVTKPKPAQVETVEKKPKPATPSKSIVPPKPIAPPKPVTPPEPKQTQVLSDMIWHKDSEHHVKFLRPKGMRTENKGSEVRFINNNGSAYLTYEPEAYTKDGGNYTSSEELCKYVIGQMQEQFGAKLIGKIEKVKVGGISGHKMHFTWKMETQPLEQIEIALDGPDKIYTLGFLATPKSFKNYKQKFNQLVNSFELNKPAPKTPKPASNDKKKTESMNLYVDGGPLTGTLSKDTVAVIFTTEKSGPHTVKCNSMNKAAAMMILYDSDGKQIDSNFKDGQLYRGFRNQLEGNKSYFFFVAPLNDEDHGKTFEVEVVSE